ncbi:MAG: hypothetical protein A3G33_01985 [Omnitrophica bacterium RIFCSPLOWO2_12_FULL_44_17]|uniref:Uncharacterized protein n=1 Tax=Candidatus Danuiimicrobium aquiferis TaxID=1801832 RepID=A0A1G1KT73_9BACT|nr:MAG: hypothetical protein A3B72_04095 [Omnitrophica bacterium RIFCSPHIGHO2_02_FULL_45_28]OGW91509.1 MAG: hypothetical protein A3E74_05340 [Omnitrophica bacterium RIFCSPHIGHO2_12_FULL_44_12]OGW96107.1 MAG: hypothetical protein A3G33_01985 [Omnitrophica bacterium RIFCSPLOWO2_12_FULL_44_17]OGX04656.1 MAG: hypothetical protein A3J12_11455 [Omnitrophica bacterium RIFCSPLOWO2_02_FULL_44_11]
MGTGNRFFRVLVIIAGLTIFSAMLTSKDSNSLTTLATIPNMGTLLKIPSGQVNFLLNADSSEHQASLAEARNDLRMPKQALINAGDLSSQLRRGPNDAAARANAAGEADLSFLISKYKNARLIQTSA